MNIMGKGWAATGLSARVGEKRIVVAVGNRRKEARRDLVEDVAAVCNRRKEARGDLVEDVAAVCNRRKEEQGVATRGPRPVA